MNRLDRYILRQMVAPFGLCIALITTVLIMDKMLKLMELIINKGVPASLFLMFLLFLMPSLLVLSIPMAVLVSILMTFSRMSADNEIVALKATGVSLFRMLRAPLIFGLAGWLVSSSIMLYVLPYANRPAKEKIAEMAVKHFDTQIQPMVFYDQFKDAIIYAQEIPPDERLLKNIFVSRTEDDGTTKIVVASRGRFISVEQSDQVSIYAENGTVHELPAARGDRYSIASFESYMMPLLTQKEREKLRKKIPLGHREMTISELRAVVAGNMANMNTHLHAYEEALLKTGDEKVEDKKLDDLRKTSRYWQWMYNSSRVELHKKFSLPFACVIFAIIAVPLGIFSRRRKQGGSIGISILLFLVYYVLLSGGENLGDNGDVPPFLSVWFPNILLSVFAAFLLYYSSHEKLPRIWTRLTDWFYAFGQKGARLFSKLGMIGKFRPWVPGGHRFKGYWTGSGRVRFPRLLDRYIMAKFIRIMGIVTSGLIAVFCVVNFIEVIDDVIEHKSGVMSAVNYMLYSIPQLLFWTIPMAVLVTAMMTINLMARGNELTVLLSGGISLQRVSVGILTVALMASSLSFALNEYIVPYTNREAERIKHEDINQREKKSKFSKHRMWYRGAGNRIYNITYIDQRPPEPVIKGVTIFEFDDEFRIKDILQADTAYYADGIWCFEDVDIRWITPEGPRSETRGRLKLKLEETPGDFIKLRPNPDEMSYKELSDYIEELRKAGYSYQQYETDLANKIALPTIAVIIALIAVPLGAMAGKSGKLIGLGAAIGIAGLFFVIHSSFISFGHSGRIPDFLAAWAANALFGIVGLFLYSHART
ncbi:MAG: LPS export ABC transporter permease LptG [Candidatus Coatesbacteria bacterium]|nr:LPS export ABC transporter permease LptG [Candidatus Coatesbacteria bacterium]